MPFSYTNEASNIYYIKFEGDLNYNDHQRFRLIFDEFLNGHSFGVIFDLRYVTSAPMTLVMEQAKYMKEYEDKAKNTIIATCIILDQKWMQILLNSLFMIKKPIAPNFITDDKDDAVDFIRDSIYLFNIERRRKRTTSS